MPPASGPGLLQPPVSGDPIMGKYLIAWLLGVPAVVLVLLYMFFS